MTVHRRFLLPTRLVSVLVGLLTVVFVGSSSSAQTPTAKKPAIAAPAATTAAGGGAGTGGAGGAAAEAPKVKVERGAGGKKVYRITEEIRIEGKIQKPEAFFFYQKSSINYDWQELKQDVIPRIIDSVSRAPF